MGQDCELEMSDHGSHDSSRPPPAPPSRVRPPLISTPEQVAEDAQIGRQRSKEALDTATAALEVGKRIERAIGRSPDPAQGIEGSGMLLGLSRMLARLDAREVGDRESAAIARAESSKAERWRALFGVLVLIIGTAGTIFTMWKGMR